MKNLIFCRFILQKLDNPMLFLRVFESRQFLVYFEQLSIYFRLWGRAM